MPDTLASFANQLLAELLETTELGDLPLSFA